MIDRAVIYRPGDELTAGRVIDCQLKPYCRSAILRRNGSHSNSDLGWQSFLSISFLEPKDLTAPEAL